MRNADGIESAQYCAMFTSFSLTRNADGIESARLWSILPVSNNIAELPGLALDPGYRPTCIGLCLRR